MNRLLLAIALLFFLQSAFAQNYGYLQHDRVAKACRQGDGLTLVQLFAPTTKLSDDFVHEAQLYSPLKVNIAKLYAQKPWAISITLQSVDGKDYTLELVVAQPTSADAVISYVDEHGQHTTPHETGLHYQGRVKGTQKSVAAISVFPNGEVMMLFSCDDGNFNMGKLEDGSGQYMLYNSRDRLQELNVSCATSDTFTIDRGRRSAGKTTGAILCKKLRIHWECDYTFYQSKVTLAATQNYLMGIFNFMQSIYYNEGMAIELSSFKIWTIDDPFTPTNAWDASWLYGRYWQTMQHTYYGVQPHLIANFAGWQGYANLGAICFPNGYACSNLLGQQSTTYPVFDVDVYVVSHETGHTVGADHTQSCGWNTGPGGTCGSVDNCAAQYGGGCGTCFYLHDANATNFKGTIMSYCGGKINFSEGFGTVVGNFMRTAFNNHSCFSGVLSPELVVRDICNNDGAVTLNYMADNYGVAPYNYTWSNGPITKDISGLGNAGIYSVNITDSNNCTAVYTAEVKHFAKPGDGNTLPGVMPYCCKDTAFNVTIDATVPVNLTTCQTVAWLRTGTPITSYNDALTAYANSGVGDILASTNDSLINNSTAAQLTVQSPANCTSIIAYYYTPFVSRKGTQQKTYTTNAGNPVTIKNGNFSLGTSMTIPAEPTFPAVCEQDGPAVSDTITVAISNYTGRANNLTIRVISSDKRELYEDITLAGDGIYKIPITTDNHFQEMTVKAYDFNCSLGNTCTGSSLSMSAVRVVTYHAMPALIFDSSCVVGTSVLLSFGPDSCNLMVNDIISTLRNISLYPNPAFESVELKFTAHTGGAGFIKLVDVWGRVIQKHNISYKQGSNTIAMSLDGVTKGLYFVSFSGAGHGGYNTKLLVK